MAFSHVAVMAGEVVELLRPASQRRYLDGTLGGGGHAEQILIASSPDGQLLGIDKDDEALAAARTRLARFGARLIIRKESFAAAKELMSQIGWVSVHGVILDLGVSSHQLESGERGFSFRLSGRLDMRMDAQQPLDAYQIVNTYAATELERILRDYGEEPHARRIARAIVAAREAKPIATTAELVDIVAHVKTGRRREHHPATQTFQALRIAVNRELEELDRFLDRGYELLEPGGRMVVISFHSLEDRRVKTAFRKWSQDCLCPPRTPRCLCGWSRKARLLTKKPIVPSATEMAINSRARSAKLRAVEKI
jgi:16S rRNA (cytosine1402-N4)-methyltransferase